MPPSPIPSRYVHRKKHMKFLEQSGLHPSNRTHILCSKLISEESRKKHPPECQTSVPSGSHPLTYLLTYISYGFHSRSQAIIPKQREADNDDGMKLFDFRFFVFPDLGRRRKSYIQHNILPHPWLDRLDIRRTYAQYEGLISQVLSSSVFVVVGRGRNPSTGHLSDKIHASVLKNVLKKSYA